jgi:hypothetical protein
MVRSGNNVRTCSVIGFTLIGLRQRVNIPDNMDCLIDGLNG